MVRADPVGTTQSSCTALPVYPRMVILASQTHTRTAMWHTCPAPKRMNPHLCNLCEPLEVLLILAQLKVGDAALHAARLVDLAPQHHFVVGARGIILPVEAACVCTCKETPSGSVMFQCHGSGQSSLQVHASKHSRPVCLHPIKHGDREVLSTAGVHPCHATHTPIEQAAEAAGDLYHSTWPLPLPPVHPCTHPSSWACRCAGTAPPSAAWGRSGARRGSGRCTGARLHSAWPCWP